MSWTDKTIAAASRRKSSFSSFGICKAKRLGTRRVKLTLLRTQMSNDCGFIFVKAAGRGGSMFAIGFTLLVFLALNVHWNSARAQPEYGVLGEPALLAKTPDHDFLIAVTLAGNRIVAVGEHGIVIYSDDNGRSWRQAAVPVDLALTTVAFATPRDGWAGGALGVILHTSDGGVTWTTQITGVQVDRLIMAAARHFAVSHPGDPMVPRALRRAGIFSRGGADEPFLSVLPYDANSAQVFGAYRMCVKTKDAGRNWQDCSLDLPDPISHNLYDAVQSGSSVFVVGESGSAFRSNDQGNTFSALTAPADDTLFGILVTSAHTVLTYGVAGVLLRSTDQGVTWSKAPSGSQSDLTAGIILKSGVVLLVDETGTIFLSSDDGLSFRALPENQGMALSGAVEAQNGDVVLVGSGGVRVLPLSALR